MSCLLLGKPLRTYGRAPKVSKATATGSKSPATHSGPSKPPKSRAAKAPTTSCSNSPTLAGQPTSGPSSRGYSYNSKGQLLVDGYPYIRSTVKGVSIKWRCAELRKYRCSARVKTVGRALHIVDVEHNHAARKEKPFNSIIWGENEHGTVTEKDNSVEH